MEPFENAGGPPHHVAGSQRGHQRRTAVHTRPPPAPALGTAQQISQSRPVYPLSFPSRNVRPGPASISVPRLPGNLLPRRSRQDAAVSLPTKTQLPAVASAQAEINETNQPQWNRYYRDNEVNPDPKNEHNQKQQTSDVQLPDPASNGFREAEI